MNLLLVEDDSEISQLLLRYLTRQGFVVTHVGDGIAAIAAFNAASTTTSPFDVVLTDGLLPGKNGYQVAQAIRGTAAGARVGLAMMSAAFRGNRARTDALNSGMDAYFAKPFVLSELRDSLITLARRHRTAIGAPLAPLPSAATPTGLPARETAPPFAGIGRPPSVDAAPPAVPRSPTRPFAGIGRPATADLSAPATSTSTVTPVRLAEPRATSGGFGGVGRATTGSFGGVGRPAPLPSTVGSAAEVARLLLAASRRRFDGVLRLADGPRVLQLAWLNGVVVGAADNAPEHALGQWLFNQGRLTREQLAVLDERLRVSKERVAEAMLALGFVTGTEALALVEAQARARVRRCLSLQGNVTFVDGGDAAGAMAVGIIDIVEVILGVGLEAAQQAQAQAFVTAHGREVLLRTPDFDSGLVAFARLRPTSTLPAKLLERSFTVDEAASVDKAELYAMWLAGLVRVAADADPGPRSVARAVKSSVGAQGTVDEVIVHRIAGLLLRARGVSIYRLLEVSASSTTAEVQRRLRVLQEEIGREALATARLGPATSAARELWTILEEAVFIFADERRRQSYDEDLRSAAD